MNKSHYLRRSHLIKFDEIKSITYLSDYRYINALVYRLLLVRKNSRNYSIYKGEENACKKIGNAISKFIGKPLIHKK
jgi:hypothetical protein